MDIRTASRRTSFPLHTSSAYTALPTNASNGNSAEKNHLYNDYNSKSHLKKMRVLHGRLS